jgi:hypothetical protein
LLHRQAQCAVYRSHSITRYCIGRRCRKKTTPASKLFVISVKNSCISRHCCQELVHLFNTDCISSATAASHAELFSTPPASNSSINALALPPSKLPQHAPACYPASSKTTGSLPYSLCPLLPDAFLPCASYHSIGGHLFGIQGF